MYHARWQLVEIFSIVYTWRDEQFFLDAWWNFSFPYQDGPIKIWTGFWNLISFFQFLLLVVFTGQLLLLLIINWCECIENRNIRTTWSFGQYHFKMNNIEKILSKISLNFSLQNISLYRTLPIETVHKRWLPTKLNYPNE